MKNVLMILDGQMSKKLLQRVIQNNINNNNYDIVYSNDYILPKARPLNFTFYKFDPTSSLKLKFILNKTSHHEALVVLSSKDDTMSVIEIIQKYTKNFYLTVYDVWDISIDDPNIYLYKGNEILANGLVQRLPNIPVIAQDIGLQQGEIMQIKIPFGSSFAYRYIGSIAQVDWKIFALYRNQALINVKPSIIIKPNDMILIVGKPDVLTQVYNAISQNIGYFPMPFGDNIYLFCDMSIENIEPLLASVKKAKILHQRIKNKQLVIKIVKPTNTKDLASIKNLVVDMEDVQIEIDYSLTSNIETLKQDKKRFSIGLFIMTPNTLLHKSISSDIIDLKIPIFKTGTQSLLAVKHTMIVLNDTKSYEQISPIIFDISTQIKVKIKVLDNNPIHNEQRDGILAHFENLAKIFNQDINIASNTQNPIIQLKKQKEILQILPFKKAMFEKRMFYFFNTNSDLLSFDLRKYNQLLIPIIENED